MDPLLDVIDSNEEKIVDGDLYLIKTISRYPILWDRKNFDSDLRNQVWLKLSEKLMIRLDWLKKRWSYLREQYVRHLKQINNLETEKSCKKSYKYFEEMAFLANHIHIRSGNYQETVFHNVLETTKTDVDNSTDKENENENIDFIITENEIEEYNDEITDMFVELSDEENEELHQTNNCFSDQDVVTRSYYHNDENDTYATTDKFEQHSNTYRDACTLQLKAEPITADMIEEIRPMNIAVRSKLNETRCEDVIFGELVTSMLKKMDSENRKRAKKEILNILLS